MIFVGDFSKATVSPAQFLQGADTNPAQQAHCLTVSLRPPRKSSMSLPHLQNNIFFPVDFNILLR